MHLRKMCTTAILPYIELEGLGRWLCHRSLVSEKDLKNHE
ncbi:hypothetical protein ACJ73_06439 [Blastomyces percursus]|uniref:Uncharacterized protein n=1 Tax=Blastomyces percursus TaxID=1658174 RepID=A0A1J9QPU8_9EURO|nr:hypothetical protein ACJ73_06439 [Blastomyces percursus]